MNYNKLSSKEFDELMCHQHPTLYTQRNWPSSKTCMCWGFCIGQGWFNIVADLSNKIEEVIKDLPNKEEFQVVQVKEKFAQLRYYMDKQTPEIRKLIQEATELSGETCEECGKPGKLDNTRFWVVTCCSDCSKKRKKIL